MEESVEDRILELMDFVAGFCTQDQTDLPPCFEQAIP
jgi:hypothetical protein